MTAVDVVLLVVLGPAMLGSAAVLLFIIYYELFQFAKLGWEWLRDRL